MLVPSSECKGIREVYRVSALFYTQEFYNS